MRYLADHTGTPIAFLPTAIISGAWAKDQFYNPEVSSDRISSAFLKYCRTTIETGKPDLVEYSKWSEIIEHGLKFVDDGKETIISGVMIKDYFREECLKHYDYTSIQEVVSKFYVLSKLENFESLHIIRFQDGIMPKHAYHSIGFYGFTMGIYRDSESYMMDIMGAPSGEWRDCFSDHEFFLTKYVGKLL